MPRLTVRLPYPAPRDHRRPELRSVPTPLLSRLVVCITAALLITAVWLGRPRQSQPAAGSDDRGRRATEIIPLRDEVATAPEDENESLVAAAPAPAPNLTLTKREVIEGVLAVYRKLQLTRELDLEQRRFGTAYWRADRSPAELAQLRNHQNILRRDLGAEATRAVAAYFPGETIDPITFAPLFDEDHPGPNVSFLSNSARQRFEAELLASNMPITDHLDEAATRSLPSYDLEWYRRWNDRAAVALRHQLAAFDATEDEFNALLQYNRSVAETGETPGGTLILETQLGTERFAQFMKLTDPTLATAVQDLDRRGLPVSYADWLASTRRQASAEIQQVWQNLDLTDEAKAQRVTAIERRYGQTIDAKFGLRGSSLDEVGHSP